MGAEIREKLNLPPIDQVGFVVRDMEAALKLYEPLFGPFSTMDSGEFEYDYRGEKDVSSLKLAFGRSGEVEIELIQWVSGRTPHKEFIDAGREGMHHLRFRVDNLDEKVIEAQALGYHSIWQTRYGEGLAVAYLEREGDPLLLEFFENLHE
jgi:catechol 2,3-dioxygenase-like lactoylglutathione lyase family enzyme